MEEKNKFEYSYSAKQQEEVDAIKKKYLPKEEKAKELSKLEELKKLDKEIKQSFTMRTVRLQRNWKAVKTPPRSISVYVQGWYEPPHYVLHSSTFIGAVVMIKVISTVLVMALDTLVVSFFMPNHRQEGGL